MIILKKIKYLLILSFFIFFLIFISFLKPAIYAQFPSFEIYNNPGSSGCGSSLNCAPYPTVMNANISGPEDDIVTITADVHDVSGVLTVVAIIKNSSGNYVMQAMQNIFGISYGTSINTVDYPEGVYSVDISATDTLLNNSMSEGNEYIDVGSFSIGSGVGWLDGWSHRKKITIDNTYVDSDLSDFPLYVKISSDADLSKAKSNGYDIRFTQSDGTTLLKYERETWSGGGGSSATGNFWVKIPIVSNTANTDIYVYYGNSGAAEGADPTNVWDSNFKGVWHMGNSLTISTADSTANGNNGINYGVTALRGKVVGAGSFSYSYIASSKNIGISGNSAFTIETWIYPGDNPRSPYYNPDSYGRCIVAWGSASCNSANFLYYDTENNRNRFEVGFYCNDNINTPTIYPKNNWYYVANTYNGSSSAMFINGAQSFTWTPGSVNVSDTKLRIGLDSFPDSYWGYENQGRYYDGTIDEVRISNIARSADWIKFEYHNINEADHEINFNSEEAR